MELSMSFQIAKIEFVNKAKDEGIQVREQASSSKSSSSRLGSIRNKKLDKNITSLIELQDFNAENANADNIINDDDRKIFEVQFNPKELRFTGYGTDRETITTKIQPQEKKANDVKAKNGPNSKIELEIPLVFDATNISDAFMFGYSQINLYSVKNLVQAKSKELTVQPVVEGFIGALRNEKTRTIRFSWGDMLYEGVMNNVSCTYTMFSTSGKPIRANVNLRLITTANDKLLAEWKKKYTNYFSKPEEERENSQVGQSLSSLLNI